MKKIITIIVILIAANTLFAQPPGGAPRMAGGPGGGSIGHVYGKITDSAGKPLSDVSVVLLQSRQD
ncbi:MAG: hypothetical protein ABIR15_06930, partial [Chitinophagaceae bacterium]